MLAHPVSTVQHALAAWPAMRELLAERSLPATSLDRLVGADRNLALVLSGLELVKEVAHAYDATVNDVLLTVTAGVLRGLLSSTGNSSKASCCGSMYPCRCIRGRALRHGEI